MKKTDYTRKIIKENRKYNFIKFKSYLAMKASFGRKKCHRQIAYSIFERERFWDGTTNGLPDSKYFKPTDIVLYDLIQKEDLASAKIGLIKLFKKCYSHKFLSGSKSEKDIDDLIKGLDQTVHSGNSWYNIGLFDFAYNAKLDSYIDYFELRFRNFSSSYAAMEMRISLANPFVTEISNFVKNHYKKPGMCVHRHWGRSPRKSGAKIVYGVSSGARSDSTKSQLVYEQLEYVKSLFLRKIKRYLPLMQFTRHEKIYGINLFETNITYTDKFEPSVYYGLGLNEMHGFNFSIAERLYVSTEIIWNRDSYATDMMLVFNPNLIGEYAVYSTANYKAVINLTMDYMEDLYRAVILKNMGIYYLNLISNYRNIINKCKPRRGKHKTLLKVKYLLNKDFYDFKKIDEELPVEEELERLLAILNRNPFAKASIHNGFHTAQAFIGNPEWIWRQIRNNYFEIESDLNRKLEISDSLVKFSSDRSNDVMTFIQLILAMLTFVLLIFPEIALRIADFLKMIWNIEL